MSLHVGAPVTFDSVNGQVLSGVVAAVDRDGDQVRVMDVLAPLDSHDWCWSEWVPLEAIR